MKYDLTGVWVTIAAIVVGICSHFNVIVGQSEALNVIVALVALFGTIKSGTVMRSNAIAGGYHPSQIQE